jgi:hypothetical protein
VSRCVWLEPSQTLQCARGGSQESCTTYQAGHSYGQSNIQPSCCLVISLVCVCVLMVTSTCMACVTANAMCLLATPVSTRIYISNVNSRFARVRSHWCHPQKTLAYGTTVLGRIWAAAASMALTTCAVVYNWSLLVGSHGFIHSQVRGQRIYL